MRAQTITLLTVLLCAGFGRTTASAVDCADSPIYNACDFDPWPFAAQGDLDLNLTVDVFDLFVLLSGWGTDGPGAELAAPEDTIDVFDLFVLLSNWGPVDLTGTEYGRAWVFAGSPIDFESGSYALVPQVEVLLDHLGIYDSETGQRIGSNNGALTGKYLVTGTIPIPIPSIDPIVAPTNDFRVDYLGAVGNRRAPMFWNSEASMFHHLTRFRRLTLTAEFIEELSLGTERELNLVYRQFSVAAESTEKPSVSVWEKAPLLPGGIAIEPDGNFIDVAMRLRDDDAPFPPVSMCWAHEALVGDYAGLAANWILSGEGVFPSGAGFGQTAPSVWMNNVLGAVSDGFSTWVAYRYARALDPVDWRYDSREHAEVYKYFWFALRDWGGHVGSEACDGDSTPRSHIRCGQGQCIDNVMMFNELDTSKNGVFPFSTPSGMPNNFGPINADLAAPYFAAIFYDLANWVGLGDYKADLLFWKTISLIDSSDLEPGGYPMREFGRDVLEAARLLWPDPNALPPGSASKYEQEIHDLLISRGIAVDAPLPGEPGAVAIGSADFKLSLPVDAGMTIRNMPFSSSHPNSQPTVNQYGLVSYWADEFEATPASVPYVAYRMYKYCSYGPCDRFEVQLADGTYTSGVPNDDGTHVWTGKGREVGNRVIFLPGNRIRFHARRYRCPHEGVNDDFDGDIGFYGEDVRPFGYLCTHADINGFSMTVIDHGWIDQNSKSFDLNIFDPSNDTKNPDGRTYTWTITQASHAAQTHTGETFAGITLFTDEPATINIVRDSDGNPNTTNDQLEVEFSESATQLGRENGMGFVVNGLP